MMKVLSINKVLQTLLNLETKCEFLILYDDKPLYNSYVSINIVQLSHAKFLRQWGMNAKVAVVRMSGSLSTHAISNEMI